MPRIKKKGVIPAPSKRKRARVEEQEKLIDSVQDLLLPDQAGYLEAEGLEKTHRFSQAALTSAVDLQTSRKVFDLSLEELGPYRTNFSHNGRYMIICGEKGHVASMEWKKGRLQTELQLREKCRDAIFLHNDTMFAVAQKKYVYIYDNTGSELHCLRNHTQPNKLTFLPHHFLLVSIGQSGWLKYQDTSTGSVVAEHRTKLGDCDVMTHSPRNAVVVLGHNNGTTTMWTPNMSTPVVKMFCHRAPIRAAAVDSLGQYLVTSGTDRKVKIWDLRKTYEALCTYTSFTPASDVAVSQKGLLGVLQGVRVEIWKDALASGKCTGKSLSFCPFEDIAALGHAKGVSTMLVPGAGEAHYDAYDANPYESYKQRREAEVHQLLDKMPADMISLDPDMVMKVAKSGQQADDEEERMIDPVLKEKRKTRGRNRAIKRLKKKETFVVDRQRDLIRAKKLKELEADRDGAQPTEDQEPESSSHVLDRFK